jgi:carbonic anhydrase/acetyltransferase-like protein (isoleucine patch superfamily)
MSTLETSKNSLLPQFLLPNSLPIMPQSVFVAPGAHIIGAVKLGEECSVWYGAVIRADINSIRLGAQTNIQDGCVLHVADAYACEIGERVTLGHRAIAHACKIEDEVLVGMNATILDGAVLGARSVIAAGAVVPKGMMIPPGSLVMGMPARVIRSLTLEEQSQNARLAHKYVETSRRYLALGMAAK